MLHGFDDYPLHQTPAPFLHPVTDSPNAYDRFFFNGYRADGSVFFALALGVYPNRRVMDAAFSVIRDGVQHNLRASRLCPIDRTRTEVGPIAVEIIEPMLSHRIIVGGSSQGDDHGIRAELTWTSISPAIEEPRFTHATGTVIRFDYTRLTQFGSWSGWIELDGERIEIGGPDGAVVGCRDRSWGIRSVGAPIPGPPAIPQFFWIWAPSIFDDACTHFALNQEADGRAWHQSGAATPRLDVSRVLRGEDADADRAVVLDPSRVHRGNIAEVEISWQPGTRWAEKIITRLHRWEAPTVEVTYEPMLRFQMSGIGYMHPEWGHGMWRKELDVTRDQIVLDEVDPESITGIHIQALSVARWGDRVGIGTVEQMVLGTHTPTGLSGVVTGFTTPGP
jgi:hypothetical protein